MGVFCPAGEESVICECFTGDSISCCCHCGEDDRKKSCKLDKRAMSHVVGWVEMITH